MDTLRYMWVNLSHKVSELQSSLLRIQPKFRSSLITDVEQYRKEVVNFVEEYSNVSY